MISSFDDVTRDVDKALASSPLLARLGYSSRKAVLREAKRYSPDLELGRGCRFTIETAPERALSIDVQSHGQDYSICVTFINNQADDEFLLDEWMREKNIQVEPYPWLLSAYVGSTRDRITHLVTFLEGQLSSPELLDILAGRTWKHIPYDWGAMK